MDLDDVKTVQYTPASMITGLVVFGFAVIGVQTVAKTVVSFFKKD